MGLLSRQRSAGLETRRTLSKLELQLPYPALMQPMADITRNFI